MTTPTALDTGCRWEIAGQGDVSTDVLSFNYGYGRRSLSGLMRMDAGVGRMELTTDLERDALEGERFIFLMGDRQKSEGLITDVAISETIPRRARCKLVGTTVRLSQLAIDHAALSTIAVSDAAEILDRAGQRFTSETTAGVIAPHAFISNIAASIRELERYGGFWTEDEFGGIAVRLFRDQGVSFVSEADRIEGVDRIPFTRRTPVDRRKGISYTNAILVSPTVADAGDVSTASVAGGPGGDGFDYYLGFDVAEPLVDDANDYSRTGIEIDLAPDGSTFLARAIRKPDAATPLTVDIAPGEPGSSLSTANAPAHVQSRNVHEQLVAAILRRSSRERLTRFEVSAAYGSTRFDALARTRVGDVVGGEGSQVIEHMRFTVRRGSRVMKVELTGNALDAYL